MKKLIYTTGSIIKVTDKDHLTIIKMLSNDVNSAYQGLQSMSTVHYCCQSRLIETIQQMYPDLEEFNISYNHKNEEIRVLNKMEKE